MASLRQLKKQMVHAAVVENVDLIRNRLPLDVTSAPPLPERRRPWIPTLSILFVLAAGAAVALSPGLREQVEGLARKTAAFASGRSAPAVAATDLEQRSLAASEPETIVVMNPETSRALRFDEAPKGIDHRVFSLGLRTVVIDPGHGGGNHGTEKDDLREKDLTLDIAKRLEQLLLADGLDVLMTRTDDVDVDLDERVAFANRHQGDLFLSIHVNWLGRAGGGVETFYLGSSDDPRIVELTTAENRDSGYTLKDFRNLLDSIYVDVRRDESRSVATAVQRAMHTSLREVSPKLRDRGVKTAPFVVLIGTQMPAILAEVSSLSDAEEARLLRDDAYKQRIAEALHTGVLRYAESLNAPEIPSGVRAGTEEVASEPATAIEAAPDEAP